MNALLDNAPWIYLTSPTQRLFWGYLLSAAVIALLIMIVQRRSLPTVASLRDYWLSEDARLDYRYFLLSWVIKALIIAPLLLSAPTVALWVMQRLRPHVTPIMGWPYEAVVAAYTVSLFVVSDFTRYWLHRAMHSHRWLWAIHKVHHSAEQLNPVTFYRVHPIENFLFGLRYALSAGVVTGVFAALFGARLGLWTIFGTNGLLFIFAVVGANLRHSPIRLSYGRWLEYVLISPAQHQIHHSRQHARHNFGGYLAIWDWWFGSLKRHRDVPAQLEFGLGEAQRGRYRTVWQLLAQPFRDIWQRTS